MVDTGGRGVVLEGEAGLSPQHLGAFHLSALQCVEGTGAEINGTRPVP